MENLTNLINKVSRIEYTEDDVIDLFIDSQRNGHDTMVYDESLGDEACYIIYRVSLELGSTWTKDKLPHEFEAYEATSTDDDGQVESLGWYETEEEAMNAINANLKSFDDLPSLDARFRRGNIDEKLESLNKDGVVELKIMQYTKLIKIRKYGFECIDWDYKLDEDGLLCELRNAKGGVFWKS